MLDVKNVLWHTFTACSMVEYAEKIKPISNEHFKYFLPKFIFSLLLKTTLRVQKYIFHYMFYFFYIFLFKINIKSVKFYNVSENLPNKYSFHNTYLFQQKAYLCLQNS